MRTTTEIKPRYLLAAKRLIRKAGGDPTGAVEQLARWGQSVQGQPRERCIVTPDGAVVLHAHRVGPGSGDVDYVTAYDDSRALGVSNVEASLAQAMIHQRVGDTLLVTASDMQWTPHRRTNLPRGVERLNLHQVADTLGLSLRITIDWLDEGRLPASGDDDMWAAHEVDEWAVTA